MEDYCAEVIELKETDNNVCIIKEYKSDLIDKKSIREKIQNLSRIIAPIMANADGIKEIINPEKVYVARFPKEILSKMKSGELTLMKDRYGDILSNVVDSKNSVRHILRLDELNNTVQSISNLGHMINNIALQQQMADIIELLDNLVEKADLILAGQMSDRLGFIYGAWDMYSQALKLKNNQLSNSIKINVLENLNIGRQQLIRYLDTERDFFRSMPRTAFGVARKNLNGKYLKKCEEKYNACLQAVTGIALSTAVLNNIYMTLEENEVLEVVGEPVREISNKYGQDLKLLSEITASSDKTMEYIIDPINLETFMKSISDVNLISDKDYLDIRFTGRELLYTCEV